AARRNPTDGRSLPVKDFLIGDRVRVRDLPAVGSYAGRTGAVVGISRTPDGAVHGYHVKLDGRLPGNRVEVGIAFGPQELEPEAGSAPPRPTPRPRPRLLVPPGRGRRPGPCPPPPPPRRA